MVEAIAGSMTLWKIVHGRAPIERATVTRVAGTWRIPASTESTDREEAEQHPERDLGRGPEAEEEHERRVPHHARHRVERGQQRLVDAPHRPPQPEQEAEPEPRRHRQQVRGRDFLRIVSHTCSESGGSSRHPPHPEPSAPGRTDGRM